MAKEKDDPLDSEPAVGYGSPPKDTRCKPGRSGNPRGRPKGRINHPALMRRILNETAVVREGVASAK
jgi:Family of unknown function (DUF5681)